MTTPHPVALQLREYARDCEVSRRDAARQGDTEAADLWHLRAVAARADAARVEAGAASSTDHAEQLAGGAL